MHRDPPFDFYSDCTELLVVDPDSTVYWEPFTFEIELFEGFDDGLLKVAHPAVEVLAMVGNVEDRVRDELPGAVVRDVAAAIGRYDLDALIFVPFGWVK